MKKETKTMIIGIIAIVMAAAFVFWTIDQASEAQWVPRSEYTSTTTTMMVDPVTTRVPKPLPPGASPLVPPVDLGDTDGLPCTVLPEEEQQGCN